MLRLLLAPLVLVFSLIAAIILLPVQLFFGRKMKRLEEESERDLRRLASRIDAEHGVHACRICLKADHLRVSEDPARKLYSTNDRCVLCHGKGHVG